MTPNTRSLAITGYDAHRLRSFLQESEHASVKHGKKRKAWVNEERVDKNGMENANVDNGAHARKEKAEEGSDDSTAMNIAHEDSSKPHD